MEYDRPSYEERKSRQTIHTFNNFNNHFENVIFTAVMTTDCYRQGKPYKLFNFPDESQVQITFDLPENVKKPTCIHLTTTEGNWGQEIDIFLNGKLCIEKLHSAGPNWRTREIELKVDRKDVRPKNNFLVMKLREDAEYVYWLYDAVIEVSHIVPSTLADISAFAVATFIKSGQISEEEIDDKKYLPKEVTDLVQGWM